MLVVVEMMELLALQKKKTATCYASL